MKRDRASGETQHFLAGECKIWTKVQDLRCLCTHPQTHTLTPQNKILELKQLAAQSGEIKIKINQQLIRLLIHY